MTFETKDSGKRIHFDSGMQRDVAEGKTLWHLTASGPMLRRWAELLTRGAIKYEADNWMKAEGPAERKRFKESAYRHFMQWYYGDIDEDHGAAVFFNINGAEYVKEKMARGGPGDDATNTSLRALDGALRVISLGEADLLFASNNRGPGGSIE